MSSAIKSIAERTTRLTKILEHLNAPPKLSLYGLKSLRLTLAFRNDHFGARHFVKEQLPRIRYANPDLDIQVEKVQKTVEEHWRPEMELEFSDGKQETLNLQGKWSTAILKELMEVAGGLPWQKYKVEAKAEGRPVIPGEEREMKIAEPRSLTHLPSLKRFRASRSSANGPTQTPTPQTSSAKHQQATA